MTATIWPSLALGAVIGALNFFLLSRLVRHLLGSNSDADRERVLTGSNDVDAQPSRWKITLLVTLKVALVAAIIILIVQKGYVRPLALLGGFTLSLGVAIVCMTLRGSVSSPTK